jgi:MtN3 and saliva related transmembrane protein
MSEEFVQYLGYLAACLTTGCFVPQVVRALRVSDLSSISLTMYAMFVCGVGCWLIYGILLGAGPLVVSNTVTLALSATVLFLKIRDVWRKRGSGAPAARG